MIKNKAFIAGIIIVIVFVAGGFWFFAKHKKEPIVIGAIISVTGPAGPTIEGTGVRDGMLIAIEEINSFGGINGAKIELLIQNAETNPEKGREIFEEMESTIRPLLYISTHSSVSGAVAPLAEENQVVQMATIASDPAITNQKDWVFRYWPTAEYEMPTIISLLDELKIRDLGILYLDDEFGRSVSTLLREEFGKGAKEVEAKSFGIRETDFRAEIREFKDKDAIFAVGFPIHLKPIFRQIHEVGYTGAIFSSLAAADATFHGLEEANGVYITAPIIYKQNFVFTKDLKEKYMTRFDGLFTHYVAVGYDLVKLLASLLEDEELSRENVRKLLEEGFVHPGILGTVNIEKGEHDIPFPLYPAQIIDGGLKYYR